MRLLSLLLLLTLFVLPEAESRTRRNSNTVRKERSATERKIKETRRQINANLDDTRRELNRLTGLEGEMRRQDKDIRAMQRRVDSLRAAAKMIADSVAEANTRVEKLRASRADALRALRRQRQTANSATAFIFSSENFAQAYRRTRYLKELQQWQDSSAVRLAAAARVLEGRKARLDSTKTRLGMSLDPINDLPSFAECTGAAGSSGTGFPSARALRAASSRSFCRRASSAAARASSSIMRLSSRSSFSACFF